MFHGLLSTIPRSRFARAATVAAFVGVGLFFLSLAVQDIWIADLWWQLRTGQWIVEHRTLPSVDTLSYTNAGKEWIEMRWLYCLSAFLGWQAGGPALLILAETALLAASFAVLAWPSRSILPTLPGIAMLALGVWAGSTRFVVRPELVSYLLLPIFLVVLDGLRRGRCRRAGWTLPALQVLWTNAHTLFVFGPVLAWSFTAGDALLRLAGRLRGQPAEPLASRRGSEPGRKASDNAFAPRTPGNYDPSDSERNRGRLWGVLDRRMVLLSALVTGACWINPYFHRGAMFPLLLFREIHKGSILGTTITEFKSPFAIDLWTTDITASAVLAVVSAATFVLNWKRTDLIRLALWGAFLYLGGVAVRNLGLFAFAATWASLRNLQDAATGPQAAPISRAQAPEAAAPRGGQAAPERKARGTSTNAAARGSGLERLVPFAQIAFAVGLVAATWYVVTGRYNVVYGCEGRFGLGIVECNIPREATEYLLESGASPQLFHAMSDGSYLTWAAKDRFPVFVDGRLEVYGESFIEQYLNVGRQDWDAFADRWKIDVVMAHREHLAPVIKKILASTRWVLVHLDPREVVFVRDIPEHAALIARDRIDPKAPWTPRRPEPREEPVGWRRWIGSVARPWHSFGMAETFLALGSPGNAARYLDRAIPYLGADPRLRFRLGQLWFQGGDYARSAQVLREALAIDPSDAAHWCELGQALVLGGDTPGAFEAYERALRLSPRMYEAHFNMGVMLARRGDFGAAISHFREALVSRPGDAAAERALGTVEAMERAAAKPG